MTTFQLVALVYLVIVNLCGFFIMLADKQKAKKHAWRIPEKVLFLFAIIGGAFGSCAGMYVFRHKTKHWYFKLFFPLFAIIWAAVIIKFIIL